MVTSKRPYNKTVGLNVANEFLKNLNNSNLGLADLFFRANEREALGRRVIIALYLLEGVKQERIISKLGCGKVTVNAVNKSLHSLSDKELDKLKKVLKKIYLRQFPNKNLKLTPRKYPNVFNSGDRTRYDIVINH